MLLLPVTSDRFGDHQVGCGGNADRIYRHDSLRDALFSAAQSAALAPRKEKPSLVPGSASRPACRCLSSNMGERSACFSIDVTVVSTLQNRTAVGAASVSCSGYALSVARKRKVATHSEACQWWFHLFLWWSKHWGVGMKRRSIQSLPSVARMVNAWEFHHQTLYTTPFCFGVS